MPGLVIAGINSGCGKTTISMAIMGALCERGLLVQPFKVGPDFIDPMFHTFITGNASRNLDAFMLSETVIRHLFNTASMDKDISVVEGVMGLYDGIGGTTAIASTANVAKILNLPVILVVNAQGISLSIVPMIKGFVDFDKDINIKGVIINNINSESHYAILKGNIEEHTNIKVLGYFLKNDEIALKSRHLGLVPGMEVGPIETLKNELTKIALKTIDIDAIVDIANEAQRCVEVSIEQEFQKLDVNIAVPYDKAFNFYYKDNLDLLEKMGAKLIYFSPINDCKLPQEIHGIYIGGGYPEVFAKELSQNVSMLKDIQEKAFDNMPIYAECGGLMYLSKAIKTDGKEFKMAGVIDVICEITDKLQNFGYIEVEMQKDTILAQKGVIVKAHEFHYSREFRTVLSDNDYCYKVTKASGKKQWNGGHLRQNVLAGYPHIHFWTDTSLAQNFVLMCAKRKGHKANG